jgi:hypothetical protein
MCIRQTAPDSPAHGEAMGLLAQNLSKDTIGDQFELLRYVTTLI